MAKNKDEREPESEEVRSLTETELGGTGPDLCIAGYCRFSPGTRNNGRAVHVIKPTSQ